MGALRKMINSTVFPIFTLPINADTNKTVYSNHTVSNKNHAPQITNYSAGIVKNILTLCIIEKLTRQLERIRILFGKNPETFIWRAFLTIFLKMEKISVLLPVLLIYPYTAGDFGFNKTIRQRRWLENSLRRRKWGKENGNEKQGTKIRETTLHLPRTISQNGALLSYCLVGVTKPYVAGVYEQDPNSWELSCAVLWITFSFMWRGFVDRLEQDTNNLQVWKMNLNGLRGEIK